MLEIIKKAMRITHSALDDDIQRNIDTALADLARVGVEKRTESDRLIIAAVELYCKAQYNYENRCDQYQRNYETLRNSLAMNGGYNAE